jgi:hypothetical protein
VPPAEEKGPRVVTRGQVDQPLLFEGLTFGDGFEGLAFGNGLGAGVCFTTSDERLIGGQADLWH